MIRKEIFSSAEMGADLEVVPKVERDLLQIRHGVRIVRLRNGFIRRLGLEEGFIVTYINQQAIKDPETLVQTLQKTRGRVVIEGINSKGVRGYYTFYF